MEVKDSMRKVLDEVSNERIDLQHTTRRFDAWVKRPPDTRNVPTFALYARPEKAVDQLDYVFESRGFHQSIHIRALNGIEEWGASDHCRIVIEID